MDAGPTQRALGLHGVTNFDTHSESVMNSIDCRSLKEKKRPQPVKDQYFLQIVASNLSMKNYLIYFSEHWSWYLAYRERVRTYEVGQAMCSERAQPSPNTQQHHLSVSL